MEDRIITQIAPLPKPVTFKDTTKAILRVAAYARVSTDHEDQQSSLVAQTEYYKKLISERPGWQFVRIYVDDGISGLRTEHRAGFNCMVEDCLAGTVDLVLTKSISRFARNTVDSVSTIRKLKEKGIAVYFEKENIYTMDSKGEFLLTIMSSLAQEESRSISENVTWGQRKRMADGKVSLAYSRFLGYDKGTDKYTMVVNEEQAVTVRRIFRMFLQGYTPHRIAAILTEDNVTAPSGGNEWNQQTVRRMLSNEKYKGDALLQKEFTVDFLQKKRKKNEGELPQYYVEEDHEPIISPWLFDYVQKCLKERENVPGRYSGVTILSSKLECGVCGSMYTPRPWHSTSYNNLVWQCRNRIKKGPKCPTHNIYDRFLHFIIHDIARTAAFKRRVPQTVADIVIAFVGEDRAYSVKEWIRAFQKMSVWKMLSDEDDLALVLQRITVMPDRTLKIRWLDGKKSTYHLPKYCPKKGITYDDK
jgi:DNA invertase Pin-like site-specific DNA recombinase